MLLQVQCRSAVPRNFLMTTCRGDAYQFLLCAGSPDNFCVIPSIVRCLATLKLGTWSPAHPQALWTPAGSVDRPLQPRQAISPVAGSALANPRHLGVNSPGAGSFALRELVGAFERSERYGTSSSRLCGKLDRGARMRSLSSLVSAAVHRRSGAANPVKNPQVERSTAMLTRGPLRQPGVGAESVPPRPS